MNWGKGLVIGLGLFMSFVIFLVVMMFQAPDDSYDKDYYEKGLAYDQEYKQKKQVIQDQATPQVQVKDDFVYISFKGLTKGSVEFKRPSDKGLDKTFELKDKQVKIPRASLTKGEWKLIMRWQNQDKSYWHEENLFLP
jgi:hypothetical protein